MLRKGLRLLLPTMIPLAVLMLLMTLSNAASASVAREVRPLPKLGEGWGEGTSSTLSGTNAINMTLLGTYETGVFDESAAEIVDYDADSQRLFITNSNSDTIDVLDVSDPTTPTLINQIDVTLYGAGANSVAVSDGVVAVAVENDDAVSAGQVVFFDTDGTFLSAVEVGVLPDMLTFTPDGQKVLVANEAEPDDTDPEGSVSIIDVSAGAENVMQSDVMSVTFSAFNGQENELRARGVRIFSGTLTAEDVEPEYLAVSPDSSTAFVTLQENNAFGVINVAEGELEDILPLGVKDHRRGPATLETFEFTDLPVLGTTPAGQEILYGGFSGLWFEGMDGDGNYQFVTVPDRGPNGAPTDVDGDGANERPFALPEYQARVIRFELNPTTTEIAITELISLTRNDGSTPITGLPNIPGVDEEPVDLFGNLLNYDEFGADLEGVIVADDGSFWMVDEYRPAIYHFDGNGVLMNRFVPEGTGALGGEAAGTYGDETLPAVYSSRRPNRGFEAMALDTDDGILYAFIQTPLANPDRPTSDASDVIRILGIDPTDGSPVAEYVYLLEKVNYRDANVDKIGDAIYAGDDQFVVIERDSSTTPVGKKYIYKMDLKGATNLLAPDAPALPDGETLEQQSPDELAALGIQPVNKIKVTNLPSIGYLAGDKPEGLTLLPDGSLAVLNDNDFGLLDEEIPGDGSIALNPDPTQVVLGIISFPAGNQLDASDRDGEEGEGAINIQNWPVYGMYMPDSIASFETNGQTYYLTANEGDARDEDDRVSDLTLDPMTFPNTETLQSDAALGRYEVSTIDGDIDGDGDYDQLWGYGARSFTIWDQYGNLVFDSSDAFEHITAKQVPEIFNSNGITESFDTRSDAKGPEPEAITVGQINGRTYAFVGLERVGGIMVYDVTDPHHATFVLYERGPISDLAPEGFRFISAADSPTGQALLVVANEVSGSTSIYSLEGDPDGAGALTLLHNNDGESSLLPIVYTVMTDTGYPNTTTVELDIGSVAAFKTLTDEQIEQARNATNAVVNVYAGDAFLASAALACSLPPNDDAPIYDAVAQRQIPYDAHILGNHEFDYSPDFLEQFIREFEVEGELTQPFLSANLDFSEEPGFDDLVDEDGLIVGQSSDGRVVARSLLMTDSATGQRFGIVGATTPGLASVSSPRDVIITSSDITETAQVVQQEIDRLYDEHGVRKIIFVSHLQNIDNDQEIVQLLSKVDVAVAGGGDELLVNPAIDTNLQLLPGEQADIDGTYPLEVADADGRTVYIVTTAGNYKYLGRLDVNFDADGEVTGFNESSSYPRRVIPASDAADMLEVDDTVVMDADIVSSVNDPVAACLDDLANTPIVRSEILLDVSRNGVRGTESNAGNLIADSFLYVYEQYGAGSEEAVIAVQNGGGIRQNAGDILPTGGAPGTISQLDTLNVLPFDNFVTVIEQVTPEDMKEIFERSSESLPGLGGQFLQVAGFDVTVNISNSVGSRVVDLMLADGTAIIEQGEVVDGAPNVTIVTNSFTARGGDNYSWLGDNPNQSRLFDGQGNAIAYEQAWREYLQTFPFDSGLPTIQEDDPRYQPGGEGRITFLFDGDNDGIDNEIEDSVPNPDGNGTGDGNGDKIPDSQQANVVSLLNANPEDDDDAGYVTLESPADTTFVDVTASEPISLPDGIKDFPQGQFSFIIDGVADETILVTMSLHNNTTAPDSYWKQDSAGDWFDFTYDDATDTGAMPPTTNDFGQTAFTLYLRDGERGDNDDITGQITDPGAPAVNEPPTSIALASFESQGNGTLWLPVALMGLLLMAGVVMRRK